MVEPANSRQPKFLTPPPPQLPEREFSSNGTVPKVGLASEYVFINTSARGFKRSSWVLDSHVVAPHICTCLLTEVTSPKLYLPHWSKKIKCANGNTMRVNGVGTVLVQPSIATDEHKLTLKLSNTLHVPALKAKLLSIAKLDDQGYEIKFKGGQ